MANVSSPGTTDPVLATCADGKVARVVDTEASAAVDPADSSHLVAAWITRMGVGRAAIRTASSFDAGMTWSPSATLPTTSCAGLPIADVSIATDPSVAVGADGVIYVSALAHLAGDTATAIVVAASRDRGRIWTSSVAALARRADGRFFDNTSIAADPALSGRAYVVSTRYEPRGRGGVRGAAVVSRSLDGGRTWSPALAVVPDSLSGTANAPQIVIAAREARMFVFYTAGAAGGTISMVTSSDGGVTWTRPSRVSDYFPLRSSPPTFPGTQSPLRVGEDIARPLYDPWTRSLFVAFTDGRFSNGETPAVSIVMSRNGGASWSVPAAVSETTSRASWQGAIASGSKGLIAVSCFSPRDEGAGSTGGLPLRRQTVEIRLDSSGRVVHREVVAHQDLDWSIVVPTWGYFLGDYHALVSVPGKTRAVFVVTADSVSRVVSSPD
ncbi:MAG TPA: sialidase family protein [Gemmatimonadaceae bacterium]|nr:sialidase family protein [Gemmatimonadaceae bacterium]